MSSYSKKYTNLKDDQKHLFLTWETGYKNLKIYFDDQLIQTIDVPGKLKKGVEFDHPELNKVELMFSTASPIIMQVKADGQKYYPENVSVESIKNDLSSLVYVFGALSFFAVIGAILVLVRLNMPLDSLEVIIQLIFNSVIVGIYVSSAIFINRQKRWAYFMGSITFFLITLIYILSVSLIYFNFVDLFVVIVRLAILIFLITQFKKVMSLSKNDTGENYDLLDNTDFYRADLLIVRKF